MTVCLVGTPDPADREPTAFELLMVEAERPVLEAELAVVVAECAYLARPSSLARARVRRAECELGRLFAVLGRPVPPPLISERGGPSTKTESESDSDDDVKGVAS